jgi:hypothetical protein
VKAAFLMGLQPLYKRKSFVLGQLLSQADRNHYLNAVTRGLSEADQIDAWLSNNPKAVLLLPPGADPALTISPYYTKYYNFLPVRGAMQGLKDRLSNADPTTWSSITQDEHIVFGWVSVLDEVYAAFLADPKNLTVGRWQGGTRLVDIPSIVITPPPDTIFGIPKVVVLIGGAAVVVAGVTAYFVLKP